MLPLFIGHFLKKRATQLGYLLYFVLVHFFPIRSLMKALYCNGEAILGFLVNLVSISSDFLLKIRHKRLQHQPKDYDHLRFAQNNAFI